MLPTQVWNDSQGFPIRQKNRNFGTFLYLKILAFPSLLGPQTPSSTKKNIARVWNGAILNSLVGLFLFVYLSFCIFCLSVFLSFCFFVFLSFCLFVFLFFFLFVQTSLWPNVWRVSSVKSHSLCQNSKVALSDSLTKVRYRAARAV